MSNKMRTKKDVRRFGRCEYVADDTTPYGRVDLSAIDNDRAARLEDHGWLVGDELTDTGKAILFHYKETAGADEHLEKTGCPTFVKEAQREIDVSRDEIEQTNYHGLEVKRSDHPRIPETGEYFSSELYGGKTEKDLVAHALQRGQHVILKGETGTGKSELAKHLAGKTNRPAYQVNFSDEVRVSQLLGHFEVQEGDKGGTEMEWVDGTLLKAARAHTEDCSHDEPVEGQCPECGSEGGVFIADEINAADGATTMMFHSATERDDPTLTVPEKGETYDVHPDFRIIGTMNPRYAGTRQQNRAFEDRFFHLSVDYPDKSTLKDIVLSRAELNDDPASSDVRWVCKVARELQKDYKKGNISTPITPRTVVRVLEFMDGGFMGREDATKAVFLEKFPPEDQSPVEKTIEVTN